MNRWAGILASLVTLPIQIRSRDPGTRCPAWRAGRHQQPPGGLWILMRLTGPETARPLGGLPSVTSPGQ
jgi:hypothetical protein